MTKIREALSGLTQEQVQILLKGVPTRPLQLDEKAQATASLDRAVHTFLWDALDDSTRKLYLTIREDPTAAPDGIWARIFQRPLHFWHGNSNPQQACRNGTPSVFVISKMYDCDILTSSTTEF